MMSKYEDMDVISLFSGGLGVALGTSSAAPFEMDYSNKRSGNPCDIDLGCTNPVQVAPQQTRSVVIP